MDTVIELLRSHLLYLYSCGAILLFIKLLIVIAHKGLSFTSIVISFFTFYNSDDIQLTTHDWKAAYMRVNNVLNFLFYLWLVIFISYRVITLNVS